MRLTRRGFFATLAGVGLALRRKPGKLIAHLLNTMGRQVASDYLAAGFVPPVGPFEVVPAVKVPRLEIIGSVVCAVT